MYIMACDERGSIYRFSRTQSWIYGGFIFDIKNRMKISNRWDFIKKELCGSFDKELKWSHFFIINKENPLKTSRNTKDDLCWALEILFKEKLIITPISTRVPKDRASEVCYKTTKKGNQVLDYEVISVGVFSQFALFLKITKGIGEMWFDQLGSKKEQSRKQKSWDTLRKNIPTQYKEEIFRIKPEIKFFDSKNEPIIQVADFVSGVIWAASEGDEEYLMRFFHDYFPHWFGRINFVTVT